MAEGREDSRMLTERALKETAELEYRCLINGAAQFYMANRSHTWFQWLGSITAVLTALATGSVTDVVKVVTTDTAKQNAITAFFVISLGITTAALNFLDPKADRDSGLSVGRRLNALRDELRSLRLSLEEGKEGTAGVNEKINSFRSRYAEIENTMLPISDYAHTTSKAALRSNVFYKELRRLTGRTSPS